MAMLKLSDRLLALARGIDPGEAVADIGTDHGLLPIFLYNENISKKIILCDINKGPLKKAEANLKTYAKDMEADIRLGSGLIPLEPHSVDCVVIAGMGGDLIIDILAHDPVKSQSFPKYILQPRTAQDKLRRWLYANGFRITGEQLVRERHHICEIITAKPPGITNYCPLESLEASNFPDKEEAERMEERLAFEISPLLFETKDPLLAEFIQRRIRTEQNIITEIRDKGQKKNGEQIERHTRQLNQLEKNLERLRYLDRQIDQ